MTINKVTTIKELEEIYGWRATYMALYILLNMPEESSIFFKELMDQLFYECNFNGMKLQMSINGKKFLEI